MYVFCWFILSVVLIFLFEKSMFVLIKWGESVLEFAIIFLIYI